MAAVSLAGDGYDAAQPLSRALADVAAADATAVPGLARGSLLLSVSETRRATPRACR